MKAFCGIITKKKYLIRQKNVKIMSELTSVKIWEEFATIHSKICEKKSYVAFFADPMAVLMECDERLAMNEQYYFEDVIVDFEKIIICENKLLDVFNYQVKAKTVKAKCYLPFQFYFQ